MFLASQLHTEAMLPTCLRFAKRRNLQAQARKTQQVTGETRHFPAPKAKFKLKVAAAKHAAEAKRP